MSGFEIVIAGVVAFTAIILALVAIILAARAALVPSGKVKIEINGDASKTLEVPAGGKLLGTLADQKIFIPSACGGGATCGQCKVRVLSGGGEILPTEVSLMTRKEIKNHVRLACQTPVKQDMKIEIPPEIFSVRKWECVVESNENIATFIKELVLRLPEGEDAHLEAGGYIQIERPAGVRVEYKNFDIPERFRADYDRRKLWDCVSESAGPVMRAYSMANYPEEKGIIKLNIRLAAPPEQTPNVPPGLMSSYLFSLKAGDKVVISGPYGDFKVRQTPCEKIYIGGGAGMAPLRSHILEMLKHLKRTEKISFWYGARSKSEAIYLDDFRQLEKEYPNFTFRLALSRPRPDELWDGYEGHVTELIYMTYLSKHKAPEDCEYFLCGPPKMTRAIVLMLQSLGVDRENIFYDDFGG